MYVWAVRRRNEEVAPPSYLEVSKPPSYSSCHPLNRGQRSNMDIVINRESWHINHYSYRYHQSEPGKCDRDWAARIQRPLQPRQQPAGQAGGEWYERGGGVWLMLRREQICDGVGTLISQDNAIGSWLPCSVFCQTNTGTWYSPRRELEPYYLSAMLPDGTLCSDNEDENLFCQVSSKWKN